MVSRGDEHARGQVAVGWQLTPTEEDTATERVSHASRSVLPILLLHVLPGIGIVTFTIVFAPLVIRSGLPSGFTVLLGFLCVGMPLELGILFFAGHKRNGSFSLRGIVPYWAHMPIWQYGVILVPYAVYGIGLAVLFGPLNHALATELFGWLPVHLHPNGAPQDAHVARTTLVVAAFTSLTVDGIANPIVEELYFRGFLLPRLARLGWVAPVVNTLLFTLGHFWQPYNYPFIFATVLPEVYLVWWKRNIRISIFLHATANTLGAVLMLVALFASH
jgi:uncharacterized protein